MVAVILPKPERCRSGGGLTRLTATCLAVALASSAAAAPSEALPTVDVQPDPHGAMGLIHAQIDIDAAPEAVWKVLVDCSRMSQLVVGLKSCRVLQRDPAGLWDMREQVIDASLLPALKTVLRSDYDEPRSVRFHRTSGDLKLLEGEWLLAPLDGGARTRVTYESRMTAPFPAPGPIVRSMLRGDMPRTLNNLRIASEAGAAARP